MSAASKKNGGKRKTTPTARKSGRQAPARRTRSVATAALNVSREATRKQDLRRKAGTARPQKRPANSAIARSNGLDVAGLINRRTKALLELPSRIARCHSPFELWAEQTRFVGESFADYARHMTIFLGGFGRRTQQSVFHG